MAPDLAIDLWREALITAAVVAAPFLIVGMVVGVAMAILQAATQVQENSLAFVPKLVALGLLLALAGPFFLRRLVTFGTTSISRIVDVGRSAGSQQ